MISLVCNFMHAVKRLVNHVNPLKPEVTIVVFIHYKPRIAAAILGL